MKNLMLRSKLGLRAEYKLRKLDGATRQVVYESPDWIPNLITDLGMDRIGANGAIGTFLRIGTGTATPAFSDTALQAQVASTSVASSGESRVNAGAPNYETTCTITYEFAQGAVVGNMAELGVGWTASTANTLATRSRILDGGGSPTTISVTASEILQVTYRIIGYPQTTDSTGVVSISGTNYNYTSRGSTIASTTGISFTGSMTAIVAGSIATAYNGALGAITGSPAGTSTNISASISSSGSYINGTYYREYTVTASIAQGNLSGGIRCLRAEVAGAGTSVWRTQTEFSRVSDSAAIPKDGTMTFSMIFRVSWARA